ncbi:MAG: hypothetical protein HXY28_10090 [Hydrogenophilaceae bacterium]|jgi:hypothetical protein|nr:hypothetical protein [Hydrogenophilaceae bacterium]
MALDGNWNIEINSPMGVQKGTLELSTAGGKLTGKQKGQQGELPVDGSVEGDKGKWSAQVTTPFPMTLEFDVTASGDTLSGTVKAGSFGSFPVKGTRA